MKIRKSILTAGTGVLLAVFGGMAIASPSPQKQPASAAKQALPKANNKSVNRVNPGTNTSIDNKRLGRYQKNRKGTTKNLTFMLNSQTERTGDLKPGSKVSVHYRKENSRLVATAIQAMPQKTASSANKPVVKK